MSSKLYLRRVIHPQAPDNFRVVLKDYVPDVEIGSIGLQTYGYWTWAIDIVLPMRDTEAQGVGRSRKDCMEQFRAAWDRFSADPARLTEFLAMKRKRVQT